MYKLTQKYCALNTCSLALRRHEGLSQYYCAILCVNWTQQNLRMISYDDASETLDSCEVKMMLTTFHKRYIRRNKDLITKFIYTCFVNALARRYSA